MTDSFHLYITGKQVFMRRQARAFWRQARVEQLGQADWDPALPSTLTLPTQDAEPQRRSALHVYVGSALCRFIFTVLPPDLHDRHEQLAVARAQMQHQLGLDAAQWNFTLEPVSSSGKTLVCAVRCAVMDRVDALAREHGLRLVSLKPFTVGVWNAFHERASNRIDGDAALVAVESDAFTLFATRSGVLDAMSTLPHRCESDLVDREVKRLGFSFSGDTQNIRVALTEQLAGIMHADPDILLHRSHYLTQALYADFRDVLFASEKAA